MRKLTLMAAAVSIIAGAAIQANAASNDTARVNATVPPQISIGGSPSAPSPPPPSGPGQTPDVNTMGGQVGGIAYGQTLDAGRDGTNFWATGYWLIHSNVQTNQFGCGATDLYKGGVNPVVGGDPNTTPIPLDQGQGASLTASLAEDISGNGGSASYVDVEQDGNWTFYVTNKVTFHAGTQEPTQWVSCTTHWTSDDQEKAQGDYIGFQRVYAMYGGGEEPSF